MEQEKYEGYQYSKERKEPTEATCAHNRRIAEYLGIDLKAAESSERINSTSHCIKRLSGEERKDETGKTIWSLESYDYLNGERVPDSVNPSLWLNARSLYESGVYSIVDRDIVQVRGLDLANIAFIRSKTGWIVLDTGSTVEAAQAAVRETEAALGEAIQGKIRAVIISHSHGDHFGGILGIVSEDEKEIPIYVPKDFDESTRDEYVYIGNAMNRRGMYQVGAGLPAGPYGKLSIGCGLDGISGRKSYKTPTDYIREDCTIEIDGIHVDFILANETEAVSNMLNYFQEYQALWVADNCIGTLHNLYTIRGAKIRDARLWTKSLLDVYYRYRGKAKVVFEGHACPHWNTEETPDAVEKLLLDHAAVYGYTHDQTLRRMAEGETANEIARELKFPDELVKNWYLRPYYGTYENNIRAVYHKYLGYYDANPVHLNPLSPTEEAKKFIEYVGSEEKVLDKAAEDFAKGEYQFAAQAANMVVFVDPDNEKARYLCADALEQLGYQEESAIFRNAYLLGAKELRERGILSEYRSGGVRSILVGLNGEQLLDYLAMTVDGLKLAQVTGERMISFTDGDREDVFVKAYGGTLLKHKRAEGETAGDIRTISISRQDLIEYIARDAEDSSKNPLYEDKFMSAVQDCRQEADLSKAFAIIEP